MALLFARTGSHLPCFHPPVSAAAQAGWHTACPFSNRAWLICARLQEAHAGRCAGLDLIRQRSFKCSTSLLREQVPALESTAREC
jgi:hypothetical protein